MLLSRRTLEKYEIIDWPRVINKLKKHNMFSSKFRSFLALAKACHGREKAKKSGVNLKY